MAKWKRSKKTNGPDYRARRLRALDQLEEDLKTGKLRADGQRTETPLTDLQVTRIKKERENLKAKL